MGGFGPQLCGRLWISPPFSPKFPRPAPQPALSVTGSVAKRGFSEKGANSSVAGHKSHRRTKAPKTRHCTAIIRPQVPHPMMRLVASLTLFTVVVAMGGRGLPCPAPQSPEDPPDPPPPHNNGGDDTPDDDDDTDGDENTLANTIASPITAPLPSDRRHPAATNRAPPSGSTITRSRGHLPVPQPERCFAAGPSLSNGDEFSDDEHGLYADDPEEIQHESVQAGYLAAVKYMTNEKVVPHYQMNMELIKHEAPALTEEQLAALLELECNLPKNVKKQLRKELKKRKRGRKRRRKEARRKGSGPKAPEPDGGPDNDTRRPPGGGGGAAGSASAPIEVGA